MNLYLFAGNPFDLKFWFSKHFALLLIIFTIMPWWQRILTSYTNQRSWYNKPFKTLIFLLRKLITILVCIRNYQNSWATLNFKITYKTLWGMQYFPTYKLGKNNIKVSVWNLYFFNALHVILSIDWNELNILNV